MKGPADGCGWRCRRPIMDKDASRGRRTAVNIGAEVNGGKHGR